MLLGINIASFLYATYGVGNNYQSKDHGLVKGVSRSRSTPRCRYFAIMWGVGVYQARLQLTPQLPQPSTQVRPGPSAFDAPAYDPGAISNARGLMFSLSF